MASDTPPTGNLRSIPTNVMVRLGAVLLMFTAIVVIWLSNLYFTQLFTQSTRVNAERQLSLYSGRIISDLQRNAVVPLLLARDTTLISALNTNDFVATSQHLISYHNDIGAKKIFLLDFGGRVVATSDRKELGIALKDKPVYVSAMRSSDTVFSSFESDAGLRGYYFSRRLLSGQETVGVIVVEVDLDSLFDTWSKNNATLIVTDSQGEIFLSTERQFRNQTLTEALSNQPVLTTMERALRATGEWSGSVADAYIRGQPLFKFDEKIPFQGWTIVYLASFEAIRARVNGILALEVMAYAMLFAFMFYILSRRATRKSFLFQAESEELRQLNDRLTREISQREEAERHLQVAEQSLAQSSKLAALGEMSAAVSHELNQPLAAMRTYLAGAKLLLKRRRPEEAMSSFQRIDDLIDRMAAITKQLKSYARKGSDELYPVDMRAAIQGSLSMMAPQLGQLEIELTETLPNHPVMVMGDAVRLEQVIVNLLRNAIDAMKIQSDKQLDILLVAGEMARLSIRDNGPGIDDLDSLFEPFYTTKQPGDGVGLGLAISSGIASDLGGRLLARNATPTGAVFEFELPLIQQDNQIAAE
ncbi:MAG: two-component system sensor histidine kinase [Rhodobacteraceae bacterium]|nr:MAG: two-component system sensor histidine kinase [Paracoccaceae bacterium]